MPKNDRSANWTKAIILMIQIFYTKIDKKKTTERNTCSAFCKLIFFNTTNISLLQILIVACVIIFT